MLGQVVVLDVLCGLCRRSSATHDETTDRAEQACDRIREDARLTFNDSRLDAHESAVSQADWQLVGASEPLRQDRAVS
jgi:hypothetical protein